jgi:HEAT repeat protein
MEIDKEKQQKALENARRIIEETERIREAQRVSRGVAEFESGNFEILRSNELVTNLANYIYSLLSQGKSEQAALLLRRLGECARSEDVPLRERAVMALSFLIGQLLEKEHFDVLGPLSKLLVDWLQFETVYITGFGVICKQIQQIGKMMLDHGLYAEAESLLVIIHQIQSGILEKGNTIRGMLSKIQENLASKEILEILVNEYLLDESKKQTSVDNLLVYLGRRAVIFLLNKLMHSDSKRDRFLLMRLIPVAGNIAVPVLVECLKKNPPWFVLRNVIYIIAEIGDPSLYSLVQPYLQHRDIRVQQEVIGCIVRLDGSKLKARLLEALPIVDDELKISLVVQLAEIGGDDVAEALQRLLQQRERFSERIKEDLLIRIISALRNFPSKETVDALKQLISVHRGNPSQDKITALAEETVLVLEPKLRHDRQKKSVQEDINFDDDPREMAKAASFVRSFEEEILSLVKKGDLDKACQKIYSRCVSAARDKDFLTAEMLRDRLLEINPMALSEVIRAGEIIEEEKSSSITSNHLKIWADLYEKMTTEEFTAMYYAMRPEKYQADEVIVRSGETDSSLYFINSGFVGIYCNSGANQTFLKRMQPGDILGVDQFFSVSVWTVTLKAQSAVQIHVLDRQTLTSLQNTHPGIDSKLQDFCLKFDIVPDLIRMAGSDRREYPRYPVSLIINNMLLDPYGHTGKRTFRGEMIDISKGGLGFSIRISNRENARLLLGRQIVTEVGLINGEMLRCAGMIVGVRFHHVVEQDFSIHVKLFKKLEQATVMAIINESTK